MAEISGARAIWVVPDLILVPPTDSGPSAWALHAAPEGGMRVTATGVHGGARHELTPDPRGLPRRVAAAHPHLRGYTALRTRPSTADAAGDLLRGQLVVAATPHATARVHATGVQIAPVLDALYATVAARHRYGPTWSPQGVPSLRVWAPTAHRVTLLTWPTTATGLSPQAARRVPMTRGDDGGWGVTGSPAWRDARYAYEVVVYVPEQDRVVTSVVTDPYSHGLTLDSTASVLVDLTEPRWRPANWNTPAPPLNRAVDQAIYELHIRDFSATDDQVPPHHRGTYLAFADAGRGAAHLSTLAAAGLNTVHLLPCFDIATIPEHRARQRRPDGDLAALPPDSPLQQERIAAVKDDDAFNWGYDPWHYLAPEGSYATADGGEGGARTHQFRTMVGALHGLGLRVVLDQVYNHTAAHGQDERSVLDRLVPGYYHRLDADGAVTDSTCCSNTATEHAMMRRLMVDAVVHWARHYRVDGFRFDLMGHHSTGDLAAVRAALDRLTLRRDGVDGRRITLYGEGWNFGEVADDARFRQARQGNLDGTGIGTFSDRLRDAVRGGNPLQDDPRRQGFATGLSVDPNGADLGRTPEQDAADLAHATDLVQLGLAGTLRTVTFTSQARRTRVRGDELDAGGTPAGYAAEPDEVVNYVDAHDNETLFDALTLALPPATPMEERVRANTVALATATLAQGIAFWHAGTDLLRSKSLDRNSYDSGDWFNLLDFSGQHNGFGRGLPPEPDNGPAWPIMRPLLADPALTPAPHHIATAAAAARDLLALRASTPLFRLGRAAAIRAKVGFPASGGPHAIPGVIALRIDDTRGRPHDRHLRQLVAVINATPHAVSQVVPGTRGASLRLSPIQAHGSDPVVRRSTWQATTGTATVPARTVAVFVEPRRRTPLMWRCPR